MQPLLGFELDIQANVDLATEKEVDAKANLTGRWAALRRIGSCTTSWFNFLNPLPF